MLRIITWLICLLTISSSLFAADKVILQLKWEHEFQFAGYYAAKWQGYYQDADLEVEIRSAVKPDKSLLNPLEELQKGNVQFAIGAMDILIGKDKGLGPVVLAPIFQRSSSAIFSLKQTDISNLNKLSKLRIAATISDATKVEIDALFRSQGYDLKNIQFVDQPVTIDTLLQNKADAIVTYEVSALFSAKEQGIELNQLRLGDFGMAFYGDTLYTSRKYSDSNSNIVHRFTEASKKGWLYALAHKQDIANRISKDFTRYRVIYDDPLQYNLLFAELIDSLLQYPEKSIGHIDKDRWFNMNERIRSLGLVRSHLDNSDFFFKISERGNISKQRIFIFLTLALFLPAIFILWYRRKLWLTILFILLGAFLVQSQIERTLTSEHRELEREKIAQKLNSISAKLQGNLQTNLSMLTGFAAYISATPDLSYQDFVGYSQQLFKKSPMLVNFASAKDLVINYVYPIEGNEKAIGLDYRKTPDQIAMVMQVVNSSQIQMIGPVKLVQGGNAFIGRAPIFYGDGELWGIISAPLDADLLYRFSDIEQSSQQMNLAIRSYDSLGIQGPIFFGKKSVFNDPKRLRTVISVGGGTWHISATPLESNRELPTNILALRIYFIFAGLFISIFVWFRFQQDLLKAKLEYKINEDKRLLETVGSVAKIGGWKLDNELNFINWSEQSSVLLKEARNFQPETLYDLEAYFSPQEFSLWRTKSINAIERGEAFDIEIELVSQNDNLHCLRVISNAKKIDNNQFIAGTIQDITDKILIARFIEHQATYDSLTGLPNRILYHDRLTKAIENAHRSKQKIAVLFIDLDRFKPINDNHGHRAGDKLLIEAAFRIKQSIRESDTVSRLSGDEFAVILSNMPQYSHVLKITEQILDKMQQAFILDEISVYLSASIGIALYPNDAEDADSLLRKADQAMYEVKASGRNGCQIYTTEMQLKSEYRHELLNQLIRAIKNRELQVYFQPIYVLKNNQITKCETLARWQKDNGEFVPPIDFIKLAEESGLINEIDLFMLETSALAMTQIAPDIELSINISPRLFHTKDYALEKWTKTIKEISRKINITVEITERLLTDDYEKVLEVLNQLKSFGIKIAIDDFGTGYSSLNYLVKYPVDIIKIDRSFVREIGIDPSAEALIETILAMAGRLKINVVAEGIETEAQLDYLKKHNCDFGQGYFLSEPMNSDDFSKLVGGI